MEHSAVYAQGARTDREQIVSQKVSRSVLVASISLLHGTQQRQPRARSHRQTPSQNILLARDAVIVTILPSEMAAETT